MKPFARIDEKRKQGPQGALVGTMALTLLLLLLTSCGRDTQVYPDPVPDSTVSVVDGTSTLPQGFYDQSVNSASVDISIDGDTATSTALRFRTQPVTTNNPGGFNGGGVGNRALLGVATDDGTALASLQPLNFDGAYYGGGSAFLSLLLVADLNCDGQNIRVLIADGAALLSGATPVDGLYSHFNADFDQSVWRASTSTINDTYGNPVLPSAGSGNYAPLTALLAAYPNACIANVASGDPGLPNDSTTAGILFSLGSSSTVDFNGAYIARLTLGPASYDFTQPGVTP